MEELVRKCVSLPHIKQLQAHLITTGLFHYHLSRSKLLDFCATSSVGSFAYATFMFDHIPQPATNDWNAIIRGLAQSNEPTNAVISYVSMRRASCNPDALTCSFVLKACARSLARLETFQMHSHVVRFGVDTDILLQTTLLDAYAKSGDLHNARVLFDEMTVRDIASWNSLISGLAQGNRPQDALQLFKQMVENGFLPNEVTCLGVLSACSQLGAFKVGKKIHNYICSQKLDNNVIVCNALIDMYAKCGQVDKAYKVFNSMHCKKNLITWNTIIMAFGVHGDGVKALELFELMRKEEGLSADGVSYLAALCACNHAGLVDEGLKLFEAMEEIGVDRNVKHYGTIVDLLGRSGRLEEAYRIMQSMLTVPDIVLWQTLLGASTTYGNVEMAEKASRKLTEMGSDNSGDFVLLSNVYAAHGRWNDVDRIRKAMKNRAVKKIPGFSYTEVDGVIHRFINGDCNHPRREEIYKKLDEINHKIRKSGHVPETIYVLHDIGPEEKEHALAYHSEKLTVAFGLISTDDSSPIYVHKNLRICGDCHVTMKLISKIYNRDIVVRDRTRFHKFKNGTCSCRDFW